MGSLIIGKYFDRFIVKSTWTHQWKMPLVTSSLDRIKKKKIYNKRFIWTEKYCRFNLEICINFVSVGDISLDDYHARQLYKTQWNSRNLLIATRLCDKKINCWDTRPVYHYDFSLVSTILNPKLRSTPTSCKTGEKNRRKVLLFLMVDIRTQHWVFVIWAL